MFCFCVWGIDWIVFHLLLLLPQCTKLTPSPCPRLITILTEPYLSGVTGSGESCSYMYFLIVKMDKIFPFYILAIIENNIKPFIFQYLPLGQF